MPNLCLTVPSAGRSSNSSPSLTTLLAGGPAKSGCRAAARSSPSLVGMNETRAPSPVSDFRNTMSSTSGFRPRHSQWLTKCWASSAMPPAGRTILLQMSDFSSLVKINVFSIFIPLPVFNCPLNDRAPLAVPWIPGLFNQLSKKDGNQ